MKNEVFVTNLVVGTSTEILTGMFAGCGEVKYVRLAPDGSYALIVFATPESVDNAIALGKGETTLRILPATPEILFEYHTSTGQKSQVAAIIDAMPIDHVRTIVDTARANGSEALTQMLEGNPGLAEALVRGCIRCQAEIKPESKHESVPSTIPPELIAQALALTEDQLALLPPERRAKLERLRAQYSSS
mmetsp:Transcript_21021/g.27252  ORF Transcript_21021/g.27252 Transcript_21021/m.27252 type:complete len:190 (+) Transcript_21021:34-603(+)|eukprot:CAMPEP_0197291692 /NCGR_PEP_ID=MMETSP0890-20130614/18269_1 /TAXON_ID=44058 ORGANISM="Aureoumbra lagunensis, Strain CCMP1510" /NCGR_SAMPLE_ID=MMETSP0890 /ASSEMBLY_ACC=CAM_ASM_000533 /LENGTH=189 /DNA_ID=CAMNT_0042764971 /DNA_START=30 /DNA_END=599 /DNA_ORIENTATION=+